MPAKFVLGLSWGLALATPAFAQTVPATQTAPQVQPAATSFYPTPLYRMNDVSKALNLTQSQIADLNKLTDQTQTRFRDDYNKLSTLNDTDRFTRLQDLNQQYNTAWNKGAGSIFNDSQLARYQQLNYQYGGFNSFYSPDVQKQLALTPDQVKDLRTHWDWSNQQWQQVNRLGATDATKGTQMFGDYMRQRQERLNKFLTPEQQKAWTQMIGDPYTFQPTFTPPR